MNRLKFSFPDDLRDFLDANTGDGTLFATPSEFIRHVLREKKERIETAAIRDGIFEGFDDIAAGRYVEFQGRLDPVLSEFKSGLKKQG